MEIKPPPQNLEAEKAVLGAILIDNQTLNKITDLLTPDSFYDLRHQIIYHSIVSLYRDGKAVDVLTLTADLRKEKKLKQVGGSSYLSEIISEVPSTNNVEQYADIIKECYVRRELIELSGKIDSSSREENKKLEDIMDEFESKLFSITVSSSNKDFFDTKTLLEMQMQKADEYAKNPTGLRGLPTGVSSMDKFLGGLHRSDLIILAARPAVGKSALAFDMARHIAVSGKTSAVFSLEMPAIQVIERMLAQQSRINLWELRMGNIKDTDFARLNTAQDELSKSKIFIDETPGINIMQLRSKARKLMIEEGLDIIIIDYLQLMQGHSRSDNRAQEVGEISRSLKILARELNVPIIALSQLNRAVENREGGQPQLSDLRESGSIEQDADRVLFLARDSTTEEVDPNNIDYNKKIKVDLYIAKHRNGPVGKVKLMFHPSHMKYLDYEGAED